MNSIDIRLILVPLSVAFAAGLILSPILIPLLERLKFGQSIRQEGPATHLKKAGTPTMGGVIILTSIALSAIPLGSVMLFKQKQVIINSDFFILLIATLGYGIIGLMDDYIKVVMKRSLGLTAKQKLLGQLVIGIILFWVLLEVRSIRPHVAGTHIFEVEIPGLEIVLQLDWLYLPLLLFIMIGTSNAVNLTDGLDGLVSGTASIAYGAYAIIGLYQGNYTVVVFSVAVVGALLSFLVFNAHPARVFMGDTGSLALGGGLAALAVITKTELLLPIIGGVFVTETLSVMIQVISFRFRGKRVFRMSPLHHHFELVGWSEWRVVTTFWIAGLLCSIIGVSLAIFFN